MTTERDLEHCFEFAKSLTVQSAKIIQDAFEGKKNIETKAGYWDLVTQFDRKVEDALFTALSKEFPTHKFIGEESASSANHIPELTDVPTWIVDPIDGTTNFVHSFPHTCISIALAVNKQVVLGIVYNPILNQMFTARKGHGAYLNGKPIRTSDCDDLRRSLICIEVSYAAIDELRDIILGRLEAFVSVAHGIRTLGSAALTLCHVAMGAAEVYHCDNLYPWDIAAGFLIIQEAGGVIIDTSGGKFNIMHPKVLALGNEKLGPEVVRLIKLADSKSRRRGQTIDVKVGGATRSHVDRVTSK